MWISKGKCKLHRVPRSGCALDPAARMSTATCEVSPGCRFAHPGYVGTARGEGRSKRSVPIHGKQHAVERVGGADIEIIALGSPEHDVGADLRDLDLADQRTVGVDAVHAVVGRGPQSSGIVKAHPVEAPGAAAGDPLA